MKTALYQKTSSPVAWTLELLERLEALIGYEAMPILASDRSAGGTFPRLPTKWGEVTVRVHGYRSFLPDVQFLFESAEAEAVLGRHTVCYSDIESYAQLREVEAFLRSIL